MLTGRPENPVKMNPSCHRSNARANHPEELPKKTLFGPIGNSKVPLNRRSCGLWLAPNLYAAALSRSSVYPELVSESKRAQVYVPVKLNPNVGRMLNCVCNEL